MRKILSILLSFSFVVLHAQTADDVISKFTAAIGGVDAYNNIKLLKLTGTVATQGMDLPITIQIINNHAVRTDVEIAAMNTSIIRAYKEGKAWQQNPFAGSPTPTALAGADLYDLKMQSMLVPPLADYKHRGSQAELLGQEDVNGVKTFKIKLSNKEELAPTTYYINASDYSLVKSITSREIQGQTKDVETWYSDVKQVNGAKMSMTHTQKLDGQEFQTVKFTTAETDKPIDEKVFDMP